MTFLDAIENKTKAGSPLAVLINDDCPSIGGIYNLDYGRAIVLTDDFRKSEAGGVPLGGYLLAAAGNQTDDGFVLDDEELVLLRVQRHSTPAKRVRSRADSPRRCPRRHQSGEAVRRGDGRAHP